MSERPLLIAHVLNGLMFGGNENLCLQLIKNSPPGLRHALFNINPPRVEMREVFEACSGLTILDRPYTRTTRVSFTAGLARDLRRIGADAVLVYPFGLHLPIAVAAYAVGIRNVLVHAGNPPPLPAKDRKLWKRIVVASWLLRVPIMACSEMVDRELRALAGVMPAGSEPLVNGVDVEGVDARAAAERAKRSPGGPRVIGMVARFNAIKDHDTLLKAFARVQRELGHCELWLIGDGERRTAIESLVKELGIAGSVRLWGERTDVHALLGGMDLFAFSTTRDEGFGIVMAEAMAARTPIVASNVAACREVLADGKAGLLVRAQDVDALAAGMIEVLTRPDAARAQADRAFAHALDHYDIKACAARYYTALDQPGRRPTRG
jgi:glycosyltransferase involved in cell wall biosynthesis